MAKALFLGLPLHGHTNPSLPLVRELVARGDEVVYYSADSFAAKIEAAGARYRPYRSAFLTDLGRLPERTEELSWLLMQATADVLTLHLNEFRAERADYLIADSVAPWGQWAGEALGVPVVTSVSTFAINRHVLAFAASHGVRPKSVKRLLSKVHHVYKAVRLGRRLRREYRVAGPGITGLVFGRSRLNIVYTSRHVQPRADTFDDSFQFVGPAVEIPADSVPASGHEASRKPVVYVSLGTLFNDDAAFYRNCFEALAGEEVDVIMSIGTNVPKASLGSAPANFMVEAHVRQLEVLGRASAFVSHGGMNSVNESLSRAVPILVVPQMSEQEMVGRRVEELGAGLYLAKAQATPAAIRGSVAKLLAEPGFRQQAAIARQSFRTAGGAARAAGAIRAFTSESPC